jgi:hypothetical protein
VLVTVVVMVSVLKVEVLVGFVRGADAQSADGSSARIFTVLRSQQRKPHDSSPRNKFLVHISVEMAAFWFSDRIL